MRKTAMYGRVLFTERRGGGSQQAALSNSRSEKVALGKGDRRRTLFPQPLGESVWRSSRIGTPSSLTASRLSAAAANAPPSKLCLIRFGACYTFVMELKLLLHGLFAMRVFFFLPISKGGGESRG